MMARDNTLTTTAVAMMMMMVFQQLRELLCVQTDGTGTTAAAAAELPFLCGIERRWGASIQSMLLLLIEALVGSVSGRPTNRDETRWPIAQQCQWNIVN